jgi:hypothetical protein
VTDELEYDPERKLWRPGRRSFLFMLGSAIGGLVVSKPPGLDWIPDDSVLVPVIDPVTSSDFAKLLVETFSRDRIFAPFERSISPFHRALREEGAVFPFEMKVESLRGSCRSPP